MSRCCHCIPIGLNVHQLLSRSGRKPLTQFQIGLTDVEVYRVLALTCTKLTQIRIPPNQNCAPDIFAAPRPRAGRSRFSAPLRPCQP
jgi:hypothetical protein